MSILDALNGDNANAKPVFGVASAIVTNNKDPEALGRVKLKFPWLADDHESNWARIATLMGGKGMGSFYLPEVGDEVLVAFERGDIDFPFVIGGLWNDKAKPPETNSDGKNNLRLIKSRCGHTVTLDDTDSKEKVEVKTNAGHQLTLDDQSGKEKVEIKTKAGHQLTMDDKSGKEKVEIKSKAGHKIVLDDASGKEKVEIKDKSGSNKIIIDAAKKSIEIESGQKLKIKSTEVTIEGTMINLKAGAAMTVKGQPIQLN